MENNTKGVVYRLIGWKSLRYRRFQDDDVGSRRSARGVLPTEEFAEIIKAEIPKWGKVLRDANVAPE